MILLAKCFSFYTASFLLVTDIPALLVAASRYKRTSNQKIIDRRFSRVPLIIGDEACTW